MPGFWGAKTGDFHVSKNVVVVDYGSGNVRSMSNALKKVAAQGQNIVVSADPQVLADADRVVVPGVGAFAEVKRKLENTGLLAPLTSYRDSGRPMLGVCVGMQVLANQGLEFEVTEGLGWVAGKVRQLSVQADQKLPHVGWSSVFPDRETPLFEGIASGTHFYFVHSFVMECTNASDRVASALYGERFVAAIQSGNVAGTQFHPEKSDTAGLSLLGNFCRWEI